MRKSYKVGGSELTVDRQPMSGGEVYVLGLSSRSSLDYSSVVLNLTPREFKEIILFLSSAGDNYEIDSKINIVP
jgi:hypothetical protein